MELVSNDVPAGSKQQATKATIVMISLKSVLFRSIDMETRDHQERLTSFAEDSSQVYAESPEKSSMLL